MAIIASGTTLRGIRQSFLLAQNIAEGAPILFVFPDYDPLTAYGDFCAFQLMRTVPGLSGNGTVFFDGYIRYPLYNVRCPSPLEPGNYIGCRWYVGGLTYRIETY